MTNIGNEIFNTEKKSYGNTPLFLGERPGLFDTVNKQYPKIWDLYKRMKSMDWDENEFDYSSCNKDFKTCSKSVYDMMIKTLAWQWEADSVASRVIGPLVAPFVSSSELWAAWLRVSDNEVLHSAAYSEIVRNSFDDPRVVINEVLSVKESLSRLSSITKVLEEVHEISHRLALGEINREDPVAYEAIFMFTCAMLCLERIQFMSSFAITFAIAETGLFLPIGKAVQKICQEELEVHVELDKAVLEIEMKTERGQRAFVKCSSKIHQMIDEVVQTEIAWTEYAFSDGRELAGLTQELLVEGVKWNAADVYRFFDFKVPYNSPVRNPLGYMEDWVNISRTQPSAQEEKVGAYMMGAVLDTAGDKTYNVDF
jgi:ribonucleoside-diphosphate reductase beta chain